MAWGDTAASTSLARHSSRFRTSGRSLVMYGTYAATGDSCIACAAGSMMSPWICWTLLERAWGFAKYPSDWALDGRRDRDAMRRIPCAARNPPSRSPRAIAGILRVTSVLRPFIRCPARKNSGRLAGYPGAAFPRITGSSQCSCIVILGTRALIVLSEGELARWMRPSAADSWRR
jgi:hypothetical protein